VITHIIARTFADADKAANAVFFIQTHHAFIIPFKGHNGTHIHAISALVADRYGIAAQIVSFDPDCALFFVFFFIPGFGAYYFANPATRAP